MKYFLLFSLLFPFQALLSQIVIEITPSDSVCYRDSVTIVSTLENPVSGKIGYQWQKNFIDYPGATDSVFIIQKMSLTDVGYYSCILLIDNLPADTSETVFLYMHPRMKVDTIFRFNDLGCYSECKGQFKTAISGGTPFSVYPPYIYEWGGGKSQDTIVFGLCPNSYTLTVTDSMGCSIDTAYLVDYLKSPKVDFKFSPRDTIYLTNPVITIAFADSMRPLISNWTWEFGDSAKLANENPVTHVYEGSGSKKVKLKYTDLNGCDTVYEHELTVKVAELDIPNVFTPNGDTRNDKFEIRLKGESKTEDFRQAYLSNEFEVFDRWGRKVFSKDNYKSEDWDGGNLSDGTYFYVLRCVSYWGNDNYHGAVTILRGNK